MAQDFKLVFCGTPQFAVPTLERLVEESFQVELVVTQPDRPRGRGMELSASPIKEKALALGLPIVQPEKIKHNEEFRSHLAEVVPRAIVVVGYGRIIPQWMLDLPPLGNINLHASLLPKYRGAAPLQWAIANGELVTGVTTMRINAGLDTGDILLQQEIPIAPEDTSLTLAPRLAEIGAALMPQTLTALQNGSIVPKPQDESRASLAPILNKEDGAIDFQRSATEIYNRLRGFQPWPGVFTRFREKNLQLWAAQPHSTKMPSAELRVENMRLFVGCGQSTSLEIMELQPEGKRRMATRDFIQGYRPQNGERLG
jgi:methionyl-tRNA formyltransferase